MPIPTKPVELIRFRWSLDSPLGPAAEIPEPFTLRPADAAEHEDALRVVQASYNLDHEWSGAARHVDEFVLPNVKKAFDGEAYALFVQHGSRVIAASVYHPEPEDGIHLISGPCVLIEYRNRGIGGALLGATLETLRSLGIKEVYGQTRPGGPTAKFLGPKFGGQAINPAAVVAAKPPAEAAAA
jgi:GNAT superfamily N-acetyltransferase